MACWGSQTALAASQFRDVWPKSRLHATCPTNDSFRTADGVWFVMCYGSYDLFYNHVMRFIGREDLVDDPRYFPTTNLTYETTTEIIQIIEQAFAQKTWEEWQPIFQENDVPVEKINNYRDILADEEVYESDILRPLPYDAFGNKSIITSPIRLGSVGDPVLYRSRPIGYDTKRIMEEYGYDGDEIAALDRAGAVKCYNGPELPASVTAPSYGRIKPRE